MSWAHGSRPKYKAHRGLPSLSLSLLGPSRPNASACAPTPRTGLRKSADGGGGRAATATLRSSPLMGGRPCRMLQCSAQRTGFHGVPSSAHSPGRRSPVTVTRRDARACSGGTGRDARAGRKKATPSVVAAWEEWDVRSRGSRGGTADCGRPLGSQHTHAACSRECLNQGVPVRGILEVIAGDERSDKDACTVASKTMQVVKHTDCVKEDQRSATDNHRGEIVASGDKVVSDDEEMTVNNILAKSRHRDGSIYRDMDTWWKRDYCIADHNETRLEAMAFSNPTNCIVRNGTCMEHFPCCMLQILSIKLAKIPVDCCLVELCGYIAVRDDLDPLLNYVVKLSRDDPIIVEQGSLINMAGPKRGIDMMDFTLIEYDMRVKTGEEEKDDLQLIDGASFIGPAGIWNQPFTVHIPGDYGAVDITLSRLHSAVEATLEVLVSEVQISFDLSLSCLTSGLNKGICLFNGTIAESCSLKRSVVAVLKESSIDLKIKIDALSSSSEQHCCSFYAKTHGHDTQEIKSAFAFISVKVTWSTLPDGLCR